MKLTLGILLILVMPALVNAQANPLFIEPTKKQVDSLRVILRQSTNDTIKMATLREFALYYLDQNVDSAYYYIDQGLPIAKNLKLSLWEADALDLYGLIQEGLGNYPKSLKAFKESLELVENKKSETNIWRISKFTNSSDPKIARLNMLATINLDMSGLYQRAGSPDKAEQAIRRTLKIATQINDFTLLSLANNRLGELYYEQGKSDTALNYYIDALDYSKKAGYKKYNGSMIVQIGKIYHEKKRHDKALLFFSEAISISKEQNNVRTWGRAYISMANVYMATGNLDSSYYNAKKGEAIHLKAGGPVGILQAYSCLAQVYKLQNKPDSALKYLEMSIAINDSLYNREKVKQFQNIGFAEQQRLQELEQEKIQTQNRIRIYGLLTGIIVILLVSFLLYRINRNRRKAHALVLKQRNELQSTLAELKNTQSQLIHAEKMASLGELTAGIAHEIQNPLNFVNNFSEVNRELITELREELENGNLAEVKAISGDLEQNEKKIGHHGKRADEIVKGMLQHSRAGSGQKEPTDLNGLADEYLRLSYHGLRAKDKSFNADFKIELDEELPKINVVPQDVGRVILNLINNAFYAVAQKAKGNEETYKPLVIISTKQMVNNIEIKVADNGNGIPQKVLDKIFQPFFTTKPTGEGTGLGLSLSYDIVKAHGGDLRVETKDGEGSVFKILLPI